MRVSWGVLVFALAVPSAAEATSYACNNGETLQQCMERQAREARENPSRPANPYEPGPHPHPVERPQYPPSAGGGQPRCNWLSAVNYAQVTNNRRGTRCGTPDSVEFDVTNIANQPLKVLVYMQLTNGSWNKEPDGTFDAGMHPGERHNFYTCHSTGYIKVVAMPITDFKANRCSYPDYKGY